jgi:hypothetical protein
MRGVHLPPVPLATGKGHWRSEDQQSLDWKLSSLIDRS